MGLSRNLQGGWNGNFPLQPYRESDARVGAGRQASPMPSPSVYTASSAPDKGRSPKYEPWLFPEASSTSLVLGPMRDRRALWATGVLRLTTHVGRKHLSPGGTPALHPPLSSAGGQQGQVTREARQARGQGWAGDPRPLHSFSSVTQKGSLVPRAAQKPHHEPR